MTARGFRPPEGLGVEFVEFEPVVDTVTEGLIAKDRRLQDSATGRRFRTGRRNVYTNRFAILNEVVRAQTIGSEQFDAELRHLVEASPEPAAPGRDA